jgi:RHS repeat-associated protein
VKISQNRWNGTAWKLSYCTYDGHGSVRQLTDDIGIITDIYTYDAFGKLIEQQVLNPNSGNLEPVTAVNRIWETQNAYLYCGEQYDHDLHMYFLRARYLNPDRGRFWTMDTFEGWNSIPESLHKYLYTHADPVNWIDPSGQHSLSEILQAASIIGFINGVVAKAQGNSFLRGFAVGFVGGAISAAGGGIAVAGSKMIGGALIGIAAGFFSSLTNEMIDLIDQDSSTGFSGHALWVGALFGGAVGGVAGAAELSSSAPGLTGDILAAKEFVESLIVGTTVQIAVDVGTKILVLIEECNE